MPKKSNGVGYFFYETTKSFHFRSWESMVASQGSAKREIKQEFYYMPMKHRDPNVKDKITHDYKSVESYRFINNFHDVAANTALGTYGHRVISHNLYDKSYTNSDFNYHNFYSNSIHTDHSNDYTDASKFAIAETPVDYDNQKGVSDYPESRTSVQSTTQFLHDTNTGNYGIDVFMDGIKKAERVSQYNQVIHGTTLKLVVKGQSYLEPGDLIQFNIRPVDADAKDVEVDHRYGGQYIISNIRHLINNDKYTMVLECTKDSVANRIFKGEPKYQANTIRGELYDIYNDGSTEPSAQEGGE